MYLCSRCKEGIHGVNGSSLCFTARHLSTPFLGSYNDNYESTITSNRLRTLSLIDDFTKLGFRFYDRPYIGFYRRASSLTDSHSSH